ISFHNQASHLHNQQQANANKEPPTKAEMFIKTRERVLTQHHKKSNDETERKI
ncbi:hypothetical protein Droror1_Dr00023624, partial [Drosera rotundifolia]